MDVNLIWQKFLMDGDQQSFSAIYHAYADELYSYGVHLGFPEEMCKDAIQDIFYKMYKTRIRLDGPNTPAAYLFKSYKNRLIDLSRKNSKKESLHSFKEVFVVDVDILDHIIREEDAILLKQKVEQMLECLSDEQREAVYMKYMLDMNYDEIGEILGMHPDSAKKMVYRAMKKMRGTQCLVQEIY